MEGLSSLEEIRDVLGERYNSLKNYWIRQVQESFLIIHNVNIAGLVSLFRSRFYSHKKYIAFADLQKLYKDQDRLIIFSTNFLELNQSPSNDGGSKREFKANVRTKLAGLREKHKILFPLLQPIGVNIFFIPPELNVADLDNIARYIIPFVNEVFQPPSCLQLYFDKNSSTKDVIATVTPPNSISGYQLITIPRKETDDKNGHILFVISEGSFSSDLWLEIDEIIDGYDEKG